MSFSSNPSPLVSSLVPSGPNATTHRLMQLSPNEQVITFSGGEEDCSVGVTSSTVLVEVGATDHTSGSSAVATRSITNYPWDHHHLPGTLVAHHCSGDYLAYAIKAPQKASGMVRIIHLKSGDRGLVKNVRGMVRDLAFAHLNQRVILAFTDQYGTLYVTQVTHVPEDTTLMTEMLLEVGSNSDLLSDHHRVIWCPYIPDERGSGTTTDEALDDLAYLLVLTHGPNAEIWNVGVVVRECGKGKVHRDQVGGGYQLMEQHSAPITDAAFSPDGTALATAALDGYVKFFQMLQVYMADEEMSPRCLHQWNPHDGKPLSALFFLDNHKYHSPDVQFWKYAITGASNNSELRVWSCESWQCLQTVRFVPTAHEPPLAPLAFKAAMDPSANFLLLSDIHRRVMYVIVVQQDGGGVEGSSGGLSAECVVKSDSSSSEGSAQMVSISELPVQYPALFLAVIDAAWRPYKRWKHDHPHDNSHGTHEEEDVEESEGVDMVAGAVVRCVLINTKSLQEATLRFQPALPHLGPTKDIGPLDLSLSQDSIGVRDGLTDLSMSINTSVSEVEGVTGDSGGVQEEQPPPPPPPDALTSPASTSLTSAPQHPTSLQTPPATQPPMNLLTPDSFSSPRKPDEGELGEEIIEDPARPGQVPLTNSFDRSYSTDFENAAISLLLRCGSGTLMQSSDAEGSTGLNILGSVVGGSSKSPPATVPLPPPPQSTPIAPSMQDKTAEEEMEEAEGQEMVVSGPGEGASAGNPGRLGASTTSSPSLEVQQILHSQNEKRGGFTDEDEENVVGGDDVRMGEMEGEEEEEEEVEEEEEEEPEALRQPLPPHPQPSEPPQPHTPAAVVVVKPPTSNPLPQPPSSSLPQPPVSSLAQSPLTSPASLHKSQPPLLLASSQPPQLPSGSQSAPPIAQALSSHGSQKVIALHDVLQPQAAPPLLDVFSLVKSLPNQLTCAQLEAEIKAGTVSPDTTRPAPPRSLQQTNRPHSFHAFNGKNEVSEGRCGPDANLAPSTSTSSAASSTATATTTTSADQKQYTNGPVTPGVSAAEIAELRSLMLTCVGLSREQSQKAASQSSHLAAKLDKAIHQINQLAKQVEEVKSAQAQVQTELPRVVAASLRPVLDASLRPVLEATLRNELRNVVLPGVIKSMEPIQSRTSQELHSLLKTTEAQVVDSISKIIHSRSFLESVGGSVGSVVGPAVQSSCREAYNKLLLPGLNALTQQIFSQVNDSFSRGTREYLQNVESEMQGGRVAVHESLNKASQSLSSTSSSLSTHSKAIQEHASKLEVQQNSLPESVGERVRTVVREEVSRVLQEHQAAVEARTRAHTPAPTPPHPNLNPKVAQQQVQSLIAQGNFNSAFKHALSAADLSLVVFVCERVNPQQVFSMTPCPLSQDVLLSLVNQLSHNLTTYTDLKIKYLEEAVMNLDMSHPVTREHMRPVMQGFQHTLATHLASNPGHKKVKMLLMAVNHLVTS